MTISTVVVFGGDGFCGWPTCLKLAAEGHRVVLVDNLSRRRIDNELSSGSLTKISSIKERVRVANDLVGDIRFEFLDVATDADGVKRLLEHYRPVAVVQFAEQRAAPYSMLGDLERRYTMDNNVSGTHNICSAIVEVDRSCVGDVAWHGSFSGKPL